MKLGELGEFGLVRRIAAGEERRSPDLLLGIGDDCAATRTPAGVLVTTTDLLLEQVHFRLDWTDLRRLGRKSVAVNVSDIAAMGASPTLLTLALGLPEDLEVEALDAFFAGFREAAAEHGAELVGGDLSRSCGGLLISVTAQGRVPEEELVRRSGARAGDGIYVSGVLGDSALALRELLAGRLPEHGCADRFHDPVARTGLGRALAADRLPSAMIDLSDGLLSDLGHLLEASGAGAEIDPQRLPLSTAFRRARAEGRADLDLALAGGEDYELLLTVPPDGEGRLDEVSAATGVPLTRIGTVLPRDRGLELRGMQGAGGRSGYRHF